VALQRINSPTYAFATVGKPASDKAISQSRPPACRNANVGWVEWGLYLHP
jgi:hypothetical protein